MTESAKEDITIFAFIIVLVILVILEALIFYTLDNLGVSGFAEIVFKAILPVIVISGFLLTKIGNR